MTLLEATKELRAMLPGHALATIEAKATINGDTETMAVSWYATTQSGYSAAFPSLDTCMANARAVLGGAVATDDDVVVA